MTPDPVHPDDHPDPPPPPTPPSEPPRRERRWSNLRAASLRPGVPATSRIRAKLILLHTVFSLSLAAVLLVAMRPTMSRLADASEQREYALALRLAAADPNAVDALNESGVAVTIGTAASLALPDDVAAAAAARPGTPVVEKSTAGGTVAAIALTGAQGPRFARAEIDSPAAARAIDSLYLVITVSMLALYTLIALTLEVLVLPGQVYRPIERLRRADDAVQRGHRDAELIPEREIPRDELGGIMRSRNASIIKLRAQERALNTALAELERAAGELKKKNHLLETAKRNLADQDRLASLGMMSAGIAHELNTPLAVLKGSVERIARDHDPPDEDTAQLMLRVVRRLEKLGEGLLDFARIRPPADTPVPLRAVAEDAWTLVSIDRDARAVVFTNSVDRSIVARGDPDRLTQVLVNILRNAADALADQPGTHTHAIEVTGHTEQRDGQAWCVLVVADSGPGLDPAVLPRLFEPFVSTRLDARGTGLGLAVAEGIVREHGGVLLARNSTEEHRGAEFEIVLPAA